MGFCFVVGTPEHVFDQDYADTVQKALAHTFDLKVSPCATPFVSKELGWSWWHAFQMEVLYTLGNREIPHLLFVSAWQGTYLPLATRPVYIFLPGSASSLQCASLYNLHDELLKFAEKACLPHTIEELNEAVSGDFQDRNIGTYIQVMISTLIALEQGQPLWLVKKQSQNFDTGTSVNEDFVQPQGTNFQAINT